MVLYTQLLCNQSNKYMIVHPVNYLVLHQ